MELCGKQVKSDCEELLSRFQQTDSVRFETFSQIWRDLKFTEIFYGTPCFEKRAFIRLILSTAYCFFLPPFSFQIRVGGLYLLYSLFHCQTTTPSEQIRLALKDWEEVKKFEKDALDAQHLDVVFILRQLMSEKAFYFTAMPTPLVYKKKRKVEKSTLMEEFMEPASRPQELINPDVLEELSSVHRLYKKLKTSISSTSEIPDLSLQLIHKDFVPELRNTVMDFYKWQQSMEKQDPGLMEDDSGEGTSSQECSSRAELLASIKSKAYGQAAETSKSRRHRQIEVNAACPEPGFTGVPRNSRIYKPSLKSRTNTSVHIAGDIWKDMKNPTDIWRLSELESVPEDGQSPEHVNSI
ncbi:snRNA-activating protein complex subunit 1b isoform X2 [Thalassophryne amazonica]|uniref:snRNA-activating protein complex subunit 1b isoform X2 n=1 Tax=Thalassophryne amazonica TaxID=390379 RepID=UPI001471ECE5|nr:snRNA-activating protein complex subunit 1b isoform X2 [Thalassophryne amazonica]